MRDVSDYQVAVDPARVRREGSLAIMIKAAEGLTNAPGVENGALRHDERSRRSHDVGMRVVHYHLLHAESGLEQARVLLHAIDNDWRAGDRLLADVENASGFSDGEEAKTVVGEWREELRKNRHTSPLGYTNRAWQFIDDVVEELTSGWLIADYGFTRRPTILDHLAVGRVPLLGRQFTNGLVGARPRTCNGISGPVDCTWLTDAGVQTILQRQP